METILRARGLSYRYPGASEPALRGLDFEIAAGEVFGFLGPNGSGKTTTQNLLTRVLPGFEGCVEVFGRDLGTLDHHYCNHIGVCFEFPNLYEKLTARENLEFYAGFWVYLGLLRSYAGEAELAGLALQWPSYPGWLYPTAALLLTLLGLVLLAGVQQRQTR